jgi:hypothetical protein
MDWTNFKINVLMELAMKFQDREHQTFISTTPMVRKSSKRPTHSSSNTKMFCSHISSKTIKSELCKAVNSFSLQEAVAGVSGEEILLVVKEISSKKAIWNKEKRSSKKDKVGIQKSSCESDMEIEFENGDSGDDISDGDAECLFCTGLFSHHKHGEKWAQCVRCYRWAHEDRGFEEDYFVWPVCRKSVKLYVTS